MNGEFHPSKGMELFARAIQEHNRNVIKSAGPTLAAFSERDNELIQVIVRKRREERARRHLMIVLKIAAIVLIALYFTACGHLRLSDDPRYMTPARVAESGEKHVSDQKFWSEIQPIVTPDFLKMEPVDDVIVVKIR